MNPLTAKKMAKPAVYFGGQYRMIDYALSNCRNSQIDVIGVVTQYEPETLHEHIGCGTPWLEGTEGHVEVLPSTQPHVGKDGYTGTANAIYQNRRFIEQFDANYVIVLSGDHVYQMDYEAMLAYHKSVGAKATIAVTPVPWEDASRFGLMSVDKRGRVTEFNEKPAVPESNLASMGIYIFDTDYLMDCLEADDRNPKSSHDFGKDVIPMMLEQDEDLYAYSFKGYWKDVGTIGSLWGAQMDLLSPEVQAPWKNMEWPLYTREANSNPMHIDERASVHNSILSPGCSVYGAVNNSVISCGVHIGKGSVLKDCVIMPNARIGNQVKLEKVIIGEGSIIHDGVSLGSTRDDVTVVGNGEVILKKKRKNSRSLTFPIRPSFWRGSDKLSQMNREERGGALCRIPLFWPTAKRKSGKRSGSILPRDSKPVKSTSLPMTAKGRSICWHLIFSSRIGFSIEQMFYSIIHLYRGRGKNAAGQASISGTIGRSSRLLRVRN